MTVKQRGVTLIEILLVLVIGAFLLVLGLRAYQSYVKDLNAERLRSNINAIFTGASNYYRAYCSAYKNPLKYGILAPDRTPATPSPFVPSTSSGIQNFILGFPFPDNPLIERIGSALPGGYVVQFNRVTLDKKIDMNDLTPPTTKSVGTIYLWKIQVAVKLAAGLDPVAYQNLLGATCLSWYKGGSVIPCTSSTGKGDFLVWERSPSFANPEINMEIGSREAQATQFLQMYTTYPTLTLTNELTNKDQYYFCGG